MLKNKFIKDFSYIPISESVFYECESNITNRAIYFLNAGNYGEAFHNKLQQCIWIPTCVKLKSGFACFCMQKINYYVVKHKKHDVGIAISPCLYAETEQKVNFTQIKSRATEQKVGRTKSEICRIKKLLISRKHSISLLFQHNLHAIGIKYRKIIPKAIDGIVFMTYNSSMKL